jgi:hypothetical protein
MEGIHKLSSPWEGPFTVAKAMTSATRGTSTSSVDSTHSLSTTLGAQLYGYSRALRHKRPSGPGTSLRTTLLQDPALTATNRSRTVQGVKDSSSGLSRDHVLLDPTYIATNGSTVVSGHAP